MSGFQRGVLAPPKRSAYFEFASLPDLEKRELCTGLLDEFGVGRYRDADGGELIHSCCLPNSRHRNGDRNASASLNWQKLTYNCFGCGSSGGLLWFIGLCRGLDTDEARDWLGSRTGFGQSVMDLSVLLDMLTKIYERSSGKMPIPSFDATMIEPWTDWEAPHPYLTTSGRIPGTRIYGRGVPLATVEHFRVGYADEYFDGSERIVIPLFWRGQLVGWQARRLPGQQGKDKYRNSPDFPRDRTLYNYDPQQKELLLVESPMSVLRHFHHVPQMTATFGAKVTEQQIQLCDRFSRVLLWFDNDEAGWNATKKVGDALNRYAPVWVVDSPWAADPGDMDDATVEELLTRLVPFSVWEPPTSLDEWTRR